MQKIKLLIAFGVCIVAQFAMLETVNAATSPSDSDAAVKAMNAQTQALEKQMQSLQTQLQQLKAQQATLISEQKSNKEATHTQAVPVSAETHTSAASHKQVLTISNERAAPTLFATSNTRSTDANTQPKSATSKQPLIRGNPAGTPGSQTISAKSTTPWLDIRGTTVITSPYFGSQPQFDGSDTLVTQSSVNKDLLLLQMRQQIDNQLFKAGEPMEDYSVIALSGELEGSAMTTRNYTRSHTSDLNLTDAELNVAALVYPWMLGYVTFQYDDSALPSAVDGSGRRQNNDNIELGQAFMTVGNLNRTPLYFSLGQLYVPFGQYTTYMYSSPLTKLIGRSRLRTAVLGYNNTSNQGFYGSIYAFSGDARISKNRNIDEGGGNLGYRYQHGAFKGRGSVGLISSIADSEGIQENGIDDNNQFQGFGANSSTERLQHIVPGFDAQGNASYHALTVLGEYTGALSHFAPQDMSFNGHGASPKAFHVETAYNYALFNRPGSYAVGYDHSWDALALNLPRNRFITAANYSIWRNTLTSLEYRHDINYGATDTGGGSIVNDDQQVLIRPAGSTNNTVTLTLDYYF